MPFTALFAVSPAEPQMKLRPAPVLPADPAEWPAYLRAEARKWLDEACRDVPDHYSRHGALYTWLLRKVGERIEGAADLVEDWTKVKPPGRDDAGPAAA